MLGSFMEHRVLSNINGYLAVTFNRNGSNINDAKLMKQPAKLSKLSN